MKLIDTNWDKKIISKEIDKLLSPYDDGELFVEEVFTENILLDDNKIKSSIGIGLDWFSPAGPMNFSLAYPISKSSNDVTESFRFNLGTTF